MKSSARVGLLRLAGFGGGEGGLTCFLCRNMTKQAESVQTDADSACFAFLSFISRASGFARVHAASFQIRNTVHNSLSNQGVG